MPAWAVSRGVRGWEGPNVRRNGPLFPDFGVLLALLPPRVRRPWLSLGRGCTPGVWQEGVHKWGAYFYVDPYGLLGGISCGEFMMYYIWLHMSTDSLPLSLAAPRGTANGCSIQIRGGGGQGLREKVYRRARVAIAP